MFPFMLVHVSIGFFGEPRKEVKHSYNEYFSVSQTDVFGFMKWLSLEYT